MKKGILCLVSLLCLQIFAASEKYDLSIHNWLREYYRPLIGEIDELHQSEVMGRVISCVGSCRLFTRSGEGRVGNRSRILELEELQTNDHAQAWVYLMDGSLVRLSPNTSVTFREINFGEKENFVMLRVNFGHLTYMARGTKSLSEEGLPETDTLFLPLKIKGANKIKVEQDLIPFSDERPSEIQHVKKYNQLKKKNDQSVPMKKTWCLIVFANGSIWGSKLFAEAFVNVGHESFLRVHHSDNENSAVFHTRGYDDLSPLSIDDKQIYSVDSRGRGLEALNQGPIGFNMSDIILRRPTSIMVAAEIWFEKYSRDLLLAETISLHNYRLWGKMNANPFENRDFKMRLDFLLKQGRRLETTLLHSMRIMQKKGRVELKKQEFSEHYLAKSLEDYYFTLKNSSRLLELDPNWSLSRKELFSRGLLKSKRQ